METSCNKMKDAREKWENKIAEGEKARFEAAQEAAAAAAAPAKTPVAQPEASALPPSSLAGLGIETSRKAPGTVSAAMTPTGSATGWNAYAGSFTSLATTPTATTPAATSGAGAGAGSYLAQHLSSSKPPAPLADTLTVFASMNVSLPLLAELVNEMLASYELWHLVGSNTGANSSSSKENDAIPTEGSAQSSMGAFLVNMGDGASERPAPVDLVGDGAAMLKRLDRMREARRLELLRRNKN